MPCQGLIPGRRAAVRPSSIPYQRIVHAEKNREDFKPYHALRSMHKDDPYQDAGMSENISEPCQEEIGYLIILLSIEDRSHRATKVPYQHGGIII